MFCASPHPKNVILNWGWEIAGEKGRKVEMSTAIENRKPGGGKGAAHLLRFGASLCCSRIVSCIRFSMKYLGGRDYPG